MSRIMRQWVLGCVLIGCGFLIWWAYVYIPDHETMQETVDEIDSSKHRYERFIEKRKSLAEFEPGKDKTKQVLSRFSDLMVNGVTLDEVNSTTQQLIQQYIEKSGIEIKSYKSLPPQSWGEYKLARVEFYLDASSQRLSDLLDYLEHLNKVIRVERLTINYRTNQENDLQVSLHIGTLFLENI
ncbi:MAG: hypothetical protein HQK77_09430 [Desulfobacterales bacterium]|nr:hypothetical protein [Desulfobacterales bacterium]